MNHNGVVGHYPTGMPSQKFNNFIFNLGQVDIFSLHTNQPFVKVHCQPTSGILFGADCTGRKSGSALAEEPKGLVM